MAFGLNFNFIQSLYTPLTLTLLISKSVILYSKLVQILFWSLFSFSFLYAQPSIELTEIASGFRNPVDIAHVGDDRLFIVEQIGRIQVIDENGQVAATPFLNISNKVRFGGELGLLGLAFHPNFTNNGYFYVNYSNTAGDTRISRFTVREGATADPNSELILLSIEQPYPNHNGGALEFGPDGFLYIALGDGGASGDPLNAGQDDNLLLGKMLRIDVDNGNPYAIPVDNPFVNQSNIRPEIWMTGLRNPWRFSFDKTTDDLWIADVGQNAREEVNFIPAGQGKGLDFGWRCFEGNNNFNASACADENTFYFPIHTYPTIASVGESVTGGYVYRGTKNPSLTGHYIYGDFVSGRIWSLNFEHEEWVNRELFKIGFREISTFGEDANGELYLAAYTQGRIYQIQQPIISANESTISATLPTIYPNPSQDKLTIQLATNETKYQLKIFNTSGQIVPIHPREIAQTTTIDISNLSKGIYYLRFETATGTISQKLVKIGTKK